MRVGRLPGLAAAVCWGRLDLFSALASRRIGSLRVTTGMQIVGAILVWAAAIATGTRLAMDPFVVIGGGPGGAGGGDRDGDTPVHGPLRRHRREPGRTRGCRGVSELLHRPSDRSDRRRERRG